MNSINTPSRIDIDAILVWLQDPNISDIHLTSSGKSSYRLNGAIIKNNLTSFISIWFCLLKSKILKIKLALSSSVP